MNNWYVFYVQTGHEETACDFLNKLFNKDESVAFVPQVELIFKNSKVIQKKLSPMFPGYVFTESNLEECAFVNFAYKYARFSKCIFRLLDNNDLNYVKLSQYEKNFLLGFCNDGYVVEESKGFIDGDKVVITLGPLKGRESVIKKIDRHKRRAEIELMWFGDKRRISVALEIVAKVL